MMDTHDKKAKYELNIEGKLHEWSESTITVAQLRELGNLPVNEPVIEVDNLTNEEVTLEEGKLVELKPGHGFGRKVEFKRG